MKTKLLRTMTVLFTCLVVFMSCSNDEEKCNFTPKVSSEMQELTTLNELSDRIDNLNSMYETQQTKGPVSNTLSAVSADTFGWNVGGKWGAKAGFFCNGFTGVIPGALIGAAVGAAFCSAAMFLDFYMTDNNSPNISDTSLFLSSENGGCGEYDELGILHNKIMLDIAENKSFFITDGKSNYPKLYNRIIKDFNDNGYKTDSLEKDLPIRLIDMNQRYCNRLLVDNISFEEVKQVFADFAVEAKLDEVETKVLDMNLKYMSKISTMSIEELSTYAGKYRELIESSGLTPARKSEMLHTNSLITNSTLCWN